VSEQEKV